METKYKPTDVLRAMLATCEERGERYGDNYLMVPNVIVAMFPEGVPSEYLMRPEWHLFELVLMKLSRFVLTGMTHVDSIHDAGVYCALVETCLMNSERRT